MADDSADTPIDEQITYHDKMEHLAYRSQDYTLVEHHRKMREILQAMKEHKDNDEQEKQK